MTYMGSAKWRWNQENRDTVRGYRRKWDEAHPEYRREYAKTYKRMDRRMIFVRWTAREGGHWEGNSYSGGWSEKPVDVVHEGRVVGYVCDMHNRVHAVVVEGTAVTHVPLEEITVIEDTKARRTEVG
jgi:hypothetical protein